MQSFGHKGRLEDARMLSGRGRYVSDWNLPGQAYGCFMRSDRPHARIASIDSSGALGMPGVIAVLTGEDVAEAQYKSLPAFAPMKGRNGTDLIIPHRPTLALGFVRYVGEPIALVVAETAMQAQDAAEALVVDYEELPAVFDAKEAIVPGAPLVHDGVPGNLALDFVGGD
ncbi:MAG: xanthine dehydrogenase family protein molybdopterin-binding subunit, partial [Proteobacteria bacterium]|nr:xanthine dehydrogenase family protein molybdopterin-binding subunit [Pseudomonadota bacterium]